MGIKGEEGVQAVNASDYAIAQFRFLTPLLLKHGRYNYIRMSTAVGYIHYKNITMSMCLFWYFFLNGYSDTKYFAEAGVQLFNFIFTSVPLVILGVYDMDLNYRTVYKYPQLYKACIRNDYFNFDSFWCFWILNSVLESLACGLLPLILLTNMRSNDGTITSLYEPGGLALSAVVAVVNMKVRLMRIYIYTDLRVRMIFYMYNVVCFSLDFLLDS